MSGGRRERTGWEPLAGSTQAVVLEILVHGPLHRTELARRLGLSVPSLSRITKPLLDSGFLVERSHVPAESLGRPSIPLDIVPESLFVIGMKLTADTLFTVVTSLRGTVVDEDEVPLADTRVDAVVAQIAAKTKTMRKKHPRIGAMAVSLGGHVVERRTVLDGPYLGWSEVPLADLVTAATGLPSWVENDVRALAQAELWFGAGRGRASFALVTIGAGVGLGLVVNGAILIGASSAAGSVGHRLLRGRQPGGSGETMRPCSLGHLSCAEALLSTSSVLASAERALGRRVGYEELLALARDDDPGARTVVDRVGRALGTLIADVVDLVDPEIVLLSGEGVGLATAASDALSSGLVDGLDRSIPVPELLVRPFRFNEWARGASAVALQMHTLGR